MVSVLPCILACAIWSQLVRGQMDLDIAQNRWMSFYENMNGILTKMMAPLHSIDFNATTNLETFNSIISGLAAREENSNERLTDEEPVNVTVQCASDEDCHNLDVTLSCVGADAFRNGQCVNPLKPSEHGCQYDDQCRKTCKESYCSTDDRFRNEKGENQCRCQKGTYYLWKKCWKSCLPGTKPMQQNDEWSCQEHDPNMARAYVTVQFLHHHDLDPKNATFQVLPPFQTPSS